MIKKITGTTNWYDAPTTTLAAAKSHMDSTSNPHNVTAAQVGAPTTTDFNEHLLDYAKYVPQPVYNVKGYGAKGDGTTDDTAAIQATIDDAITTGAKAIFCPPGTYKVTSLTNADKVVFFGDNAQFSGVSIPIWQVGIDLTKRYAFNYTPTYDLASDVLSVTLYHNLGDFTIPNDKKWYVNHVEGTNNSSGNGILRAYSFALKAGPNASGDSVRGCTGLVQSEGPADVKAIHGTAEGLEGHTGVLTGVCGAAYPASTSGESYGFQATLGDGAWAALIINGKLNDGTESVKFGIRNRTGALNFTDAFINYDAKGAGDFLRLRNETGDTVLFQINNSGHVILGEQRFLRLKNDLRDFDLQAINTDDYVRLLAGGVGDIIKFYANGGVVIGNPTDGNKGAGTLNAKAVYDDGTLLTDYVIEHYIKGYLDINKWKKINPKVISYIPMTIDEYSEYWKKEGHLPAFPGYNEWMKKGKLSVGNLTQRLWETVEVLAVYIDNLNNRLKEVEKCLKK